jgi:hypothetical protein
MEKSFMHVPHITGDFELLYGIDALQGKVSIAINKDKSANPKPYNFTIAQHMRFNGPEKDGNTVKVDAYKEQQQIIGMVIHDKAFPFETFGVASKETFDILISITWHSLLTSNALFGFLHSELKTEAQDDSI